MIYILSLSFVFLTGMTGLIYQVTWQRYLATFLGSHALATSLVIAVFFLAMSLGYYVIGKYSQRLLKNQILLYGIIEILIGAYGLISPDYFAILNQYFQQVYSSHFVELANSLLLTILFIGLPTFLMGGTIPVLTQGLVKEFETSHRIHALIYAINTFGAFLGTLIAGFYLIEAHGLPMTIMYASLINLSIGLGCWLLVRITGRLFEGIHGQTHTSENPLPQKLRGALYGISFLSGFYVFSIENILIRMAGISLGSSVYTYSLIVAAFIFAIAVGSSLLGLFRKIDNFIMLIWVQGLLALTTIGLYLSIPLWPHYFNRVRNLVYPTDINLSFYWLLITLSFLLILLIPVGLMGMNLPLLFNFLKDKKYNLSSVVGRVYSVNCLGCFFGTLLGGYYLFHFFSAETIFKLSIFFIFLTLLPISLLIPSTYWKQSLRWALGFGTVLILWLPTWSPQSLSPGYFMFGLTPVGVSSYKEYMDSTRQVETNTYLFSQFDADTYVNVIKDQHGELAFYVNGKPDAHTKTDHTVRSVNALLPLSLAPEVKNVFVIGLGTGLSTGLLTAFDDVHFVQTVELSQGVIDSLPYFSDYNHKLESQPEKYQILLGDAYKVLKSQNRTYDLIISEPSNPWISGVEKLYSVEFLTQARARLTPQGVYSQWFPLFDMDNLSLASIIKTFQSVFPWVTVWSSAGDAIIVLAANQPLKAWPDQLISRFNNQPQIYKDLDFHTPFSILGRQLIAPAASMAIAQSGAPIHSLENPILAFRAGRAHLLSQIASLQTLLYQQMLKPFPTASPLSHFLYDSLLSTLPKEFFTDVIAYSDKQDGPYKSIFKGAFDRLRFYYFNQFDDIKPTHPQGLLQLKIYRGLVLGEDLSDLNWKEHGAELIAAFRRLVELQLPGQWGTSLNIFPAQCPTVECSQLKENILHIEAGKQLDIQTATAWNRMNKEQELARQKDIDRRFSQILRQ